MVHFQELKWIFTVRPLKQVKRIRILFDEYAYYKMFSFMPRQLAANPYYNRFFESFRVTKETFPVSLYQIKDAHC
jgi:hypothetical protein